MPVLYLFFQAASMMNLAVDDEGIAKVFFDPPDYKVMENCGAAELQVVIPNKTYYLGRVTKSSSGTPEKEGRAISSSAPPKIVKFCVFSPFGPQFY